MTERRTARFREATCHEIDRRAFLKLGVAGGAGTLAAAGGGDGGNAIRPNLLAGERLQHLGGGRGPVFPEHLARADSSAHRAPPPARAFTFAPPPVRAEPRLWRGP